MVIRKKKEENDLPSLPPLEEKTETPKNLPVVKEVTEKKSSTEESQEMIALRNKIALQDYLVTLKDQAQFRAYLLDNLQVVSQEFRELRSVLEKTNEQLHSISQSQYEQTKLLAKDMGVTVNEA